MPKYCTAPYCLSSVGKRKQQKQPALHSKRCSFYKFPLHDKERLQQWLANMKQEQWMPSRHQHLCSEHFTPSCFEWKWGVRYLKPDAVPTIFPFLDTGLKRKNGARAKPGIHKKFIRESSIGQPLTGPQPETADTVLETNPPDSVALGINPCVPSAPIYVQAKPPWLNDLDATRISSSKVGGVSLVPVMQIVEPFQDSSLYLAAEPKYVTAVEPAGVLEDEPISDTVVEKRACLPTLLLHNTVVPALAEAVEQFPAALSFPGEPARCTASLIPTNLPVLAAVFEQDDVSEPGALIENVSVNPFVETDLAALASVQVSSTQMVAYFETVPTATMISSCHTASLTPCISPPETVLSSAITMPIVSTVPIVSSHAAVATALPSELLSIAAKETGMDSGKALLDHLEEQPEEHKYNSNNLTTEQLISVVISLQKKVKVLQQRHRRHCSKLETMEGIVEQLRKENLVSEEKLKLLEIIRVECP
ncbi:THAP domain-containing protein 5-like isoform X2 [Rhinatrema bivittatum]|uniref:THAP domain-containing protein 5-like isoform X2 n=1 Tax=Rhinatrema bivittatum TaxID=194408 RepID=UPI00112CF4A8|nr:THAP domain-containing protein 5-like isoform X2 [Rhinatrema bivittatum]